MTAPAGAPMLAPASLLSHLVVSGPSGAPVPPARAGPNRSRSGERGGKAVERRLGRKPDNLCGCDPGAKRLGFAPHRLHHLPQRHPQRVVHVGGHLCNAPRGQQHPDRPHTGRPPPASESAATAFATRRRTVSSSMLKATSGGRAVTSVAPAVGCRRAGLKSGDSSPPVSALLPPRGRPRAKTRARAALRRCKLPVHEHRQFQLARQPVAPRQALRLGELAVPAAEVHDRDHVKRAHTGVRALVHPHVDVLDRGPGPSEIELQPPAVPRSACRRCGCGPGRSGRRAGRSRGPQARARKPRCKRCPFLRSHWDRFEHDLAVTHGRPSYSGAPPIPIRPDPRRRAPPRGS